MSEPRPDADLSRRRGQFLDAISATSEERLAAGWADGIEETVRAEGGLWTVMAASCCGWPLGYRGEHGWGPLTPAERQYVDDTAVGRVLSVERPVSAEAVDETLDGH